MIYKRKKCRARSQAALDLSKQQKVPRDGHEQDCLWLLSVCLHCMFAE